MLEKEFFTKRRNEQLSVWPKNKGLEQWGKYCYIPLDIPKFENQGLVDWFNNKKKPIYKISPDISSAKYDVTNFEAVDVLPTGESEEQHTVVWTLNLQQDFLTLFPDIYDQIMTYYPFKSLIRMRFWSSTKNILYHRDHTIFTDNPSSFRIMLYDENPDQTLGLIPCIPDTPTDLENIHLLPKINDTNSFVWNNLRVKHGSLYQPPYRKILMILDRYDLDISKYHKLIERSVEKYNNYVLTCDRSIEEFVNL
jgi:hypothetical protein